MWSWKPPTSLVYSLFIKSLYYFWQYSLILISSIRLRRTFASLQRRVWPHLKLVSFSVILMGLLRWRVLQAARFCGYWKPMVHLIDIVCVAFLSDLKINIQLIHLFLSGLAPEIPEDLYHLIKKAVAIRKHLERNRKDKDSKFRLILVESRIHRLARYYKKTKKLPPVWK